MQVFKKSPANFGCQKVLSAKPKSKKTSRIHHLRRHTIYATIELKDIEKGQMQMFRVQGP